MSDDRRFNRNETDAISTVKEPRPLHYTFYTQSGPNREQQRKTSRPSLAFRKMKRKVKYVGIRNYIKHTVDWLLSHPKGL